MNERHRTKIQINPQNPVQYLACCGIVEIVCRFDPDISSQWVCNAMPEFIIDGKIGETPLLNCLIQALTDRSRWSRLPADGDEVTRLDVTFDLNGERRILCLDWWYETLDRQARIKNKSAWKMYAGNQTAYGISLDMVDTARRIVADALPKTLTDLMRLNRGMTGRFGFDPRSSRNALDAGFSANDLKIAIATYPFAELLAMIGAQFFFPHRTKESGGNE